MTIRILIIGYGSIGARHGRIASAIGMQVACVSANAKCPFPRFNTIADAVSKFAPDRVIIANATALHAATVSELSRAGFSSCVLVEKPVYGTPTEVPELGDMTVYVAYNLRFHPLIEILRQNIYDLPSLHSAYFRAGQYLPQWRPEIDYRQSYSASIEMGGGVLRDLSHEIDLAMWLCGRAQCITAVGGHYSDLEIQSDDVYSILSVNKRCPSVSINVNYLHRMPQRMISIDGPNLTAELNLVLGTLNINGKITSFEVDRDYTYKAQLEAFVYQDLRSLCTYEEGLDVVRFIDAAECAASKKLWVPF